MIDIDHISPYIFFLQERHSTKASCHNEDLSGVKMQKRYQFQSIFATSRTSRIIESIFEDQKSIFVCERTNCESPAGRFSTGP